LARLHQLKEEDAPTWAALRELGVFDISTHEEHGGSGLGAAEEALIVLELGRRAAAASVFGSIGASHLTVVSSRRVGASYRRGKRVILVADAHAELLLIRGAAGAVLCEPTASSRVLDATLWSSDLLESSEHGRVLAEATPAQLLRLRLIDAAALAGLARAALDMAVSYALLREQFGRPIGSYQAIKHHCADMALRARTAADQVSFAAIALDDERDDALLQVESALYVAGSAALENSGINIQIHGGIGFSDEAEPHLLLKRAHLYLEIAGGLEAALERIAEIPASLAKVAR
jgi:alkylation response protein AidB-like acyl-CoA dehydrogenase